MPHLDSHHNLPYIILHTNATCTTASAMMDFEAISYIDVYKVLFDETRRWDIGNQQDICIFLTKSHKIGQKQYYNRTVAM